MKSSEREQYEQRIQTICLLILTALGLTAALYFFASVLIPFVLAIFLTLCLIPAIDVQMKWLHIPRGAAIITTVLIGCAILALAALIVTVAANQIHKSNADYSQIKDDSGQSNADYSQSKDDSGQNKDDYGQQLRQLLVKVRGILPPEWYMSDPNDPNSLSEDPSEPLIRVPTNTIRKVLTETASSIMGLISNGLLVLIFMIFMVAGKSTYKAQIGSLWWEIESRIKRYVLTMIFTSGITGLLVGLILTILKVKFSWMFGFLAFLLNFIPNIGSIIATILPLPVALIDPELGMISKILVLVIPGSIQFVIGNLLQPKLMGESLDLHPVVVLLSLIFFGTIWGIIGMFLAVPITAVIKILLQRFGYTRAIADLIAGRTDILTKSPT